MDILISSSNEYKIKMMEEVDKYLSSEMIPYDDIKNKLEEINYEPLKDYFNQLLHKVKPETATSELFKSICKDILKLHTYPEVKVADGFIDFFIEENIGNPVLIELKPSYHLNKSVQSLRKNTLVYTEHTVQISKYLKGKNDFVILTNLKELFIFNREAILDFKPFYEGKFFSFITEYLSVGNVWDYIRRIESRTPLANLEDQFFSDLKKWNKELQEIKYLSHSTLSKDELIVTLLNKIIFIKTLEDFGLIPFKFFEDSYTKKYEDWYVKGNTVVFNYFFKEIEDWFYEFYDTELFRIKIWEFIDKDKANVNKFKNTFETVLGFGKWDRVFGKGLIHYNYRQIDEDVFGKAYESWIAESRKDSGIYYTSKTITKYMSENLVTHLFKDTKEELIQCLDQTDYEKAKLKWKELQNIKIIDPSSGSGSFLIKVLKEIYSVYLEIKKKLEWVEQIHSHAGSKDLFDIPKQILEGKKFYEYVNFDEPRLLISRMILNHIYGADLDERALETAKTNIWKEAVKLDPQAFNFRKLPEDKNHILPSLEMNFVSGDSLYDMDWKEEISILQKEFKPEIIQLHKIRNSYLDNPFHPEYLDDTKSIKDKVKQALLEKLEPISKPLFYPLEYFYCFFDIQGNALADSEIGFSGVISNPPWEAIKPIKKEFSGIGKYELGVSEFEDWFKKKIESDIEFKASWEKYQEFYNKYKAILRSKYSHQGHGDLNYYKVFLERDFELLKKNGFLNILIPSGVQTDEGSTDLRKLLIEENTLSEIYSFENRGYIDVDTGKKVKLFPDVHPQFKFSLIAAKNEKSKSDYSFYGKFYMTHPKELYETTPITYNKNILEKFSPENLAIMEFQSNVDYNLCLKIRGIHPLFKESGMQFKREFHMTDDASLFSKVKGKTKIPLYEGKMIHQFNPNFESPSHFVELSKCQKALINRDYNKIASLLKTDNEGVKKYFQKNKFLMEYETYRLVYRAIASSTNERTLISTLIPKNHFTVNSINYLINIEYIIKDEKVHQDKIKSSELLYYCALLNSLTLNFYIRNKVSANLNMFFLYELPFPTIPNKKIKSKIVELSYRLIHHNDMNKEFVDLGKEIGIEIKDTIDPIQDRATLEVIIAKEIYGLGLDDWNHLTSTFTFGGGETKRELDAIIDKSKEIFND